MPLAVAVAAATAAVCLAVSHAVVIVRDSPAGVQYGCTTSTSFDYLELVLQWPVTNCQSTSCNATDAYFTLHGALLARFCCV